MLGEKEIKYLLLNHFIQTDFIDYSSLVLSEMNLSAKSRRIDLAVIKNRRLIGIEIKSEKDSLDRLPGQVEEYRKYFDKVVLVVASKFVSSVLSLCKDDVAVWEATKFGVKCIRRGRINNSVKKENYFDLMTRREICVIAKILNVEYRDVPIYDLKQSVVMNLTHISKSRIKGIMLEGVEKRFGLASSRFLAKVIPQGHVSLSDVRLLSPYLKIQPESKCFLL